MWTECCWNWFPPSMPKDTGGTGNARLCLRVDNMNAERNDLMTLGRDELGTGG